MSIGDAVTAGAVLVWVFLQLWCVVWAAATVPRVLRTQRRSGV